MPEGVLVFQTIRQMMCRHERGAFRNLRITRALQMHGHLLPLLYCAVFRIPQIASRLTGGVSFSPAGKPIVH